MSTIGVSGAGGRLGRRVTALLPADDTVVLTTRRPADLADAAALGRDVRFADFDDEESLRTAFAGVDRLLVISTDAIGHRVQQHRAAFTAARDAGVRHVVYTSMLKPVYDHPSAALAEDHRASEALLRASGLAWTIVRFGFYAELLVGGAERAAQSGTHVSNAGDGRAGWVALDDCARVLATLLVESGHDGRTYDVVGPEDLSEADVVALFARRAGTPVRLVAVSDEEYREGLLERGTSAADAEEYTSFGQAIRGGFASAAGGAVEQLTGRPPIPLAEVLGVVEAPAR